MSQLWYYVQDSERVGPISEEELGQLVQNKTIDAQTYVWRKGFADWTHLEDVSELSSYLALKVAPMSLVVEEEEEESPALAEEIKEKVEEFLTESPQEEEEEQSFPAEEIKKSFSEFLGEKTRFYIRTGVDRDSAESEYGPFSFEQLKRLFSEKRINEKTFIFTQGMTYWEALGNFEDFEETFSSKRKFSTEQRENLRKPFVAKMLFAQNTEIFEGLCRDISIGGMQILLDYYPGEAGEKISVNVHPDNSDYNFVASGEVVRILEGRKGFSFRFLNLSESAKEAILNYLHQE